MFNELELHERLLKALDKMSFSEPTPVQAQTLPAALAGKDLLVGAETGSGKTAAFLLPILHRCLEKPAPNTGTRALILAPTRELVRQIYKHFTELSAFTHIKACWLIGGETFKYQRAVLRKNPEVVIATPGRLLEHLEKESLDLNDLEVLVLDEADRMLDMGFKESMEGIISRCPPQRQTLLLTATLNRAVQAVAKDALTDPQTIMVNSIRDPHENIHQEYLLADDNKHKDALIVRLLTDRTYHKALIFVNKRTEAERLGGFLRYKDFKTGILHGELDQAQRNHVMNLMRRGYINVLVATDVAARGLDISGIDLVVNYDMARKGDDYVHRIGRTGRAGETGTAVSMITAHDWNLKAAIERYLQVKFEPVKVNGLEGKYKGPKDVRANGKAVGKKKPKTAAEKKALKDKKKGQEKKAQKRQQKKSADGSSLGKRATPVERKSVGFGTIRKRTSTDFKPEEN